MPRDIRQARNQALYREVNNRIAELASSLVGVGEPQSFICECSRLGCSAQVEVPPEVYAQICDKPGAFLVHPGHEDSVSEEILASQNNYAVVRLRPHTPPAGELAPAT